MPEAQPPAQFTYSEQPQLTETFSDSLHTMVWDGQTLRIEFCVTRYPDLDAGGSQARATRHPVSRMVLTAAAAADLHNRLRQTMDALVKAGVLRDPAAQGAAAPASTGADGGEIGLGTGASTPPRNGLV